MHTPTQQAELPLSSTESAAAASTAKRGKKPTAKPKASATKSGKLPDGVSYADLLTAAMQIQEERADALSLLQSATVLELTQPQSARRDKKLKSAFIKWMRESDVTPVRLKTACGD